MFTFFKSLLPPWLRQALVEYGLLNKQGKVMFLGLDNAGKSTLLGLLKYNTLIAAEPTRSVASEELIIDRLQITAYDLGGHAQVRRLWKEYSMAADAVIFLVDVSDSERLHEARHELINFLAAEEFLHVPILILGNKVRI